MDKYEYRFIESTNSIAYTSYRTHNAIGNQIFFETGLESPVIRNKVTDKMVECSDLSIDQSTVAEINTGMRKAYICKKLDSGWAILPVGSVAFLAQHENMMTYVSSNYELQVQLSDLPGDKDVTMRYADREANAAMFYLGDIPACDTKAYMFRVSPCHICRIEADITILPDLGLIREKEISGETFELVSINDIPVCNYLNPNPAQVASSESQPEIVTTQSDVYVSQPEYVSSKAGEEPLKNACGIYPMEGEHLVEAGESLYGVARRYGITVNNLRSWNDMTTDVIHPCTLIKIVAPPKGQQPSMTEAHSNDVPASFDLKVIKKTIECKTIAQEGEHVVQQGESLFAIARQYNVKPEQLHAWNDLASDIIHPCDKLAVVAPIYTEKSVKKVVRPLPKTYAIVVKPKTAKVNAKPKTAVVTKSKKVVATKTKQPIVTTKTVTISEPALSVKKGLGLHIVKKGETVTSLSDRFELSETEFRKINNLESGEKIFIGQVVKTQNCACNIEEELPKTYNTVIVKPKTLVPKGYIEVVLPKPIKVREQDINTKGINDGEDLRRKYHVVQGDETLFGIARMYGTTVEKLRKANDMSENETIRTEQLLILDK